MNDGAALTLTTPQAEAQVLLETGSLGAYRLTGGDTPLDVMRPFAGPVGGPVDPLDVAAFPLVPYFSGIRDGRFRFAGKTHQLKRNFGDHPHSVHGVGWQSTWQTDDSDADRAVIALDHPGTDWPFPFRAVQTFRLDGADLGHEIALTNTGDNAMPAGLGIHPFFPRRGGARLQANVAAVWVYDASLMPTERIPCPPRLDLAEGRDVGTLDCDTVFENWDGRAMIAWPEDGLSLEITADAALNRLCVYAPADADIFCVEPVSQITDAVNFAADGRPAEATGLHVLEPGETWTAASRFRPRRTA